MLRPLQPILDAARQSGCAVIEAAFDDLITAHSLIALAEDHHAPLILRWPAALNHRDRRQRRLLEAVRTEAVCARVPVALSLQGAAGPADVQRAADAGFTSLLLNAGSPAAIHEAVEIAHPLGIAVAAFLPGLPAPAAAARLVEQTGVAALALTPGEPVDFAPVEALVQAVPAPLALFPAQPLTPDGVRRAAAAGVRQIAVPLAAVMAPVAERIGALAAQGSLNPEAVAQARLEAIRAALEPALLASGSAGLAPPRAIDIPAYAEELFREGYSCAEAILMAFSEAGGFYSDAAQRAATSFIGGLANQGLTCGTLLGGLMVIGAHSAHASPHNKEPRRTARALGVELIRWYSEQKGSTQCKDLLQLDLGDPEQAPLFSMDRHFDGVCAPLMRETCAWLVERLAQEQAAPG